MSSLKKAIANSLGFVMLLFFKRIALKQFEKCVLSIYFHNPSAILFKGIIQFLNANGFKYIDEKEYCEIVKGNANISGRSVFISFDDGWRGNLKLISVIEKYNIPITVFVSVKPVISGNFWWEYTDYIKQNNSKISSVEDLKKMTNKQRLYYVNKAIEHLKLERSAINSDELCLLHNHPLVTIGSHTYTHPITIMCSDDELQFEYRESKKYLESLLHTNIDSLSFPNGDYNERDLSLLKNNAYKMAFTTSVNITNDIIDKYEIPRISINSMGGKYENISRILGLWDQFIQPLHFRLREVNRKLKTAIYCF
nr:polysaccharide deacetylase family protein [uncultured Marinifilum sp.]